MAANENDHPLVVHGFSVGGYMWGELCAHVMKNKEAWVFIEYNIPYKYTI